MKKIYTGQCFIEIFFSLWIISNFFTNIDSMVFAGREFHWHHIFGILLLICSLCGGKKIKIPKNNEYVNYCIYAILISLVLGVRGGFGNDIFNAIYALLMILTFYNLRSNFCKSSFERIISFSGICLYILVIYNDLMQIKKIIYSLLVHADHPTIKTIVGGGVNIEATMISMFGIYFLYKKKYILWSFGILVSTVYSSRAGLLIVLIGLVFFAISQVETINFNMILSFVGMMIVVGVMAVFAYKRGYFNSLLSRFSTIGEDMGSIARLQIWTSALKVYKDNWWGVGIGNAMEYIRRYSRIDFGENNVHNVYLQTLVENGVGGFLLWCFAAFRSVQRCIKTHFVDCYAVILMTYFFICILQFRGWEVIYLLIGYLGLWVIESGEEERKMELVDR